MKIAESEIMEELHGETLHEHQICTSTADFVLTCLDWGRRSFNSCSATLHVEPPGEFPAALSFLNPSKADCFLSLSCGMLSLS